MYSLNGRTDQPLGAAAPQDAAIQHRGRKHRRRWKLSNDITLLSPW